MSRATVKPLCRSVLGALALMSFYGTASAAQIAETPFMLQQNTATKAEIGVKPNFMFLIDDSGSMSYQAGRGRRSRTTRLDVTKNALNAILNKYQDQFYWGLQTYHNNGRASYDGYTDNWQAVKRQVDRIWPDGGTPTTRRYYEVTKRMRDDTQYRCQKNTIVVLTDGDANSSCTNPSWSNITTFNYGRTFIDDHFGMRRPGQCTSETGGPVDWGWDKNDGLEFFSKTLASKDFKTTGTDRTGKSWNGSPDDPKDKVTGRSAYEKQTINTITIGLSEDISRDGQIYLERGASSSNGKKNFYMAYDQDDLLAAFEQAAQAALPDVNIAVESGSTSAPAVVTGGKEATSATSIRLDTGTWSSQIRFYSIQKNAATNKSELTNNYKVPSFANRRTLINTGSETRFFERLAADNAFFGIPAATGAVDEKEWTEALRPWTMRTPSPDDAAVKQVAERNKYSQPYRLREPKDVDGEPFITRDLGDIIDSPLVAIGEKQNGQQKFLVTAANDGMVHFFRNSTNQTHPYDLKVSYIPAAMERHSSSSSRTLGTTLKEVAHEEYGKTALNPHRYLLNGGFTVVGTPENSSGKRQYFMFGAMGQGGRGAYALNVGGVNRADNTPLGIEADPSSWESSVPLFETEKGAQNTLGLTIGTPKIGRVAVNVNRTDIRYGGFLASGYKDKPAADAAVDAVNETALYVYDMLGQDANTGAPVSGNQPGKLLKKITVDGGIGGLSTPTLLDTDVDGVYDLAYAGDFGGNLYRFDLRGPADQWRAVRIFDGRGSQPIVAAPTISYRPDGNYIIIFGTGSDIYTEELLDNYPTQAVYGIYDDVKEPNPVTVTHQDLLKQTFEKRDGGYYYLTNHQMGPNHKGWTFDLLTKDESGTLNERVVTQGRMILRTAVLETRMYGTQVEEKPSHGDVCMPSTTTTKVEPRSRQLQINSTNGGALTAKDARIVYKNSNYPQGANYPSSSQVLAGLMNSTYTASAIAGSTMTVDGEGGSSGEDQAKADRTKRVSNTCFRSKENQSMIIGNTKLGLSTADVEGPGCGQNLRRINWREIF